LVNAYYIVTKVINIDGLGNKRGELMKKLLLLVLLTTAILYSEPSQWTSSEFNLDDINLYHYVVEVDGEIKEFYSFDQDVEKVIEQEKIQLGEKDFLSIKNFDDTCYVKVIRRHEEIITEVEKIPFTQEFKNTMKITKGFTKTIQKGQPGFKEVKYKVIYEEGEEKYRELLSEQTIKSPRPEIILKGERTKVVMASGRPIHAKEILTMEASAYTHTGNTTFTGIYPEVGTIAVDPNIIPLGTRLWVEGYGYGIAEDTGKAIKGNKIDLFMETRRECLFWGRRKVRVYILGSD
jgi:3D (Asp-Asp-Asp) domain-containing protein